MDAVIWLVPVLGTALVAGSGWAYAALAGQVGEMREQQIEHGQRLTRVETIVERIDRKLGDGA